MFSTRFFESRKSGVDTKHGLCQSRCGCMYQAAKQQNVRYRAHEVNARAASSGNGNATMIMIRCMNRQRIYYTLILIHRDTVHRQAPPQSNGQSPHKRSSTSTPTKNSCSKSARRKPNRNLNTQLLHVAASSSAIRESTGCPVESAAQTTPTTHFIPQTRTANLQNL